MKPTLPRLSVSSLLRKKPFRFPSGSPSPFPRPPTLSQAPNNEVLIDEEILPFYESKQFYPARPGDVLGDKYQILVKVGWGVNSTVWFARDLEGKEEDPETVAALKICNGSSSSNTSATPDSTSSSVSATHEREIEEHISSLNPSHPGLSFLRTYLDAFDIQGPEGLNHSCLVYPPMRETLTRYQSRLEGGRVPVEIGKVWIRALLGGLEYLHGVGAVVHTDLKPENILLTFESPTVLANFMETHLSSLLTPSPTPNPSSTSSKFKIDPIGRPIYPSQTSFEPLRSLKSIPQLIDFGLSTKLPEHDDRGIWPIQAGCYRAPEVILGNGWRFPVDIWNMGVLMWDIFSGRGHGLFAPQQIHDANGRYDARRHMAQMISLLGPPSPEIIQRYLSMRSYIWPEHMRVKREYDGRVCQSAEEYFRGPFFDEDGDFLYKDLLPSTKGNRGLADAVPAILEGDERDSFLDLAQSMLHWHPDRRKSAGQLAEHPFLQPKQ